MTLRSILLDSAIHGKIPQNAGLTRPITIVAPRGVPADRLEFLETTLLETLNDPAFKKVANNAGFAVEPMGGEETWQRWLDHEKGLYPVLESAGLIKARMK